MTISIFYAFICFCISKKIIATATARAALVRGYGSAFEVDSVFNWQRHVVQYEIAGVGVVAAAVGATGIVFVFGALVSGFFSKLFDTFFDICSRRIQ